MLRNDPTVLLLGGVKYEAALYRRDSSYPRLFDQAGDRISFDAACVVSATARGDVSEDSLNAAALVQGMPLIRDVAALLRY